MKKVVLMLIRISLLLVVVIVGFLALFPEWWDLRDFQRNEHLAIAQDKAKENRTAALKEQHAEKLNAQFNQQIFTDINLLNCLKAQGKRHPNQIVNLNCSDRKISDSTGLNQLSNLTRLNLSNNQIRHLDLSKNSKLSELVAQNSGIHSVSLPDQSLRSVDLQNNQISELNLRNTSRLNTVDVSHNRLTKLNLYDTSIKRLWAENNQLKIIDLTHSTELEVLSLRNNKLSSLDLKPAVNLKHADFSFNPLHSMTVNEKTDFQFLLLGETIFSAEQILSMRERTPNLSTNSLSSVQYPDKVFRRCVEAHSFDGISGLTEMDCDKNKVGLLTRSKRITNASGLNNLFALNDVKLSFHAIEAIDVSPLLRLEYLEINNNLLESIDVRTNSSLKHLNVTNNHLKQIKLQANNSMESLHASNNKLKEIDLSETPNLKKLNLRNNQIHSLDLLHSTQLKRLHIDNNQIVNLNVKTLKHPTQLSYANNPLNDASVAQLRTLFWQEQPEMTDQQVISRRAEPPPFTLESNQFPDPLFKKCVEKIMRFKQLNHLNDIKRLDCSYQDITTLQGLELLTGLEYLILQGINATEITLNHQPLLNNVIITELPVQKLDLSKLPALKTLLLNRNKNLTSLVLPNNHSIERLTADFNALQNLQIPDGSALKFLRLQNNQLEHLSLGRLNKLIKLDVDNNQLKQLDIKHLTALKDLFVTRNKLTRIDVSHNLMLEELYLAANQINSLDLSQNNQLVELMLFDNPLSVPDLTQLESLVELAIDQPQYNDLKSRNLESAFMTEPKMMGHVIVLSKNSD